MFALVFGWNGHNPRMVRVVLPYGNTFFLSPGSLRSDRYFPSLKLPRMGPRRSPAGTLVSAVRLVAGARLACIAAYRCEQLGCPSSTQGWSDRGEDSTQAYLRLHSDVQLPTRRLFYGRASYPLGTDDAPGRRLRWESWALPAAAAFSSNRVTWRLSLTPSA